MTELHTPLPKTLPRRARRRPDYRREAWTSGDADQFEALVSACALVARADGWVTTEERQRVGERMRTLHALSVFGAEDVIQAFEEAVELLEKDPAAERLAEDAVRRLRAQPEAAMLVAAAACAVADADGDFDGEERSVLMRLCDLLDLPPGDLRLVARREGRSHADL